MSILFDMGGYAAFVWPAYGATLVGLGTVVILTWRAYGRAKARLAAVEKT
jgi:heme exporter protein D